VQPRDGQCRVGQIDAHDARACLGHRFGKDAAAAANVEHRFSGESGALRCDVAETQRVDVVQRFELAGRIPPAMRQRTELGEFGRIGIVDDFSHGSGAKSVKASPIGRR
jgi:hypothetical protein